MAMQDLPEKGLKALLIRHVEKLVFGLVCLISLFLLWKGSTYKSFDRTPQTLTSDVTSANNHVMSDTWDQVDRNRHLPEELDDDFIVVRVPYPFYSTEMPWHKPPFPPSAKRSDPDVLPVVDLMVTQAGFGPLAIKGHGPASRSGSHSSEPTAGGLFGDGEDEDQPRRLHESVRRRLPGYKPTGNEQIVSTYYVAIVGLVPNRRQFEIYEETFSQSDNYELPRDKPNWIFYYLERADVTDDPEGEVPEDAWRRVATMRSVQIQSGIEEGARQPWAGRSDEVIDLRYTYEETLTSPIPPLMLTDLERAARHPEIPIFAPYAQADAQQGDQSPEQDQVDPLADVLGGPGSSSSAAPLRPPSPEDGSGPSDDSSQYRHKLFRVFDLNVRPGHVYRYRVKLVLEDPNNPKEREEAPPISSLEDEVATRVEASRQQNPPRYWRETEWSEPTAAVAVPSGRSVLLGSVEPARQSRSSGGQLYRTPFEEPEGMVLVEAWDEASAQDMVAEKEVARGERLVFERRVDTLDPLDREFEQVDYNFSLGKVVLDMTGGENLPGVDRRDRLESGGQMLLLDEAGNLEFHDSLSEENAYRAIQYLPEDLPEDDDSDSSPGGILHGPGGDYGGLPLGD